MSKTIVPDSHLTDNLLAHLHRGGVASYYWTPNGEPYTDRKTGEAKIGKISRWHPATAPLPLPAAWANKNVFFNVHPSNVFRASYQRTRIADIAAVNCLFAEFDAKDQVTESEYAPHLPADFAHLDQIEQGKAVTTARKTEAARLPNIYMKRAADHIAGLHLPPSVIIDSGGGYHCYWLLDDTYTINSDGERKLAKDVQWAWVGIVGSDPEAKDLPRVLRLPGSFNQKYSPPRRVEFVSCDFTRLYGWQTFFDLTAKARTDATEKRTQAKQRTRTHTDAHSATQTPTAPQDVDTAEIVKALSFIPTQPGYHVWRECLMAVHSVLPGADGVSVIEAWSPGHPGEVADKFASFTGDGIGIGTVFFHAKQHGYTPPRPDPEVIRAEIAAAKLWVKSTNFSPFVPDEFKSAVGYRTDSRDTKVADALLDYAHERASWRVLPGYRALAERAGVGGPATVHRALQALSGWFCNVGEDGVIEIVHDDDVARRWNSSISDNSGEETVPSTRDIYTAGKADDPFLSGVSRTMKQKAFEIVESGQCDIFDVPVRGDTKLKQQLRDMESGLGESILRVIDAIELHGALTRAELVEVTGKTPSAIGRATRRAATLALLFVEQEHKKAPKVYTLTEGWQDSIENLRPKLKTFKLSAERISRNSEAIIAHCDQQLKRCEEEERLQIQKRREKARARLRLILPDLLGLAPLQIEEWVHTPSATNAAFEYAPILDEERTKRAESALQTLSDMVTPGRLLFADELARVRQAAGRLGLDFAQVVKSEDLEWGMAAD